HRAGVSGADEAGELALERGHLGTLRDPAAQDDPASGRGLSLAHQGFGDRNHAATVAFARHHSTSRARPSSSPTRARNPSKRSASETSARRRGTGFTLRSGPYSGRSVEPIAASSAAARSFRLVS